MKKKNFLIIALLIFFLFSFLQPKPPAYAEKKKEGTLVVTVRGTDGKKIGRASFTLNGKKKKTGAKGTKTLKVASNKAYTITFVWVSGYSLADPKSGKKTFKVKAGQTKKVTAIYKKVKNSCGSRSAFFTVEPLDPDAYTEIDPLGATNPPAHTFPTVHTYMMLTDKSDPSTVYTPGNLTITDVVFMDNLTEGSTDYSLSFSLCAEVTGYYDHVTSLTKDLLDRVGSFSGCRTYSDGVSDYKRCEKKVSIKINAGTVIGYAGGSKVKSAALDLGLRDTRVTPITYVNPGRLVNTDQLYVVCPYDYFKKGEVRNNIFAKLRKARTAEPVCGTVALDVPDTAQGKWYPQGTTNPGEQDNMALVPSNKNPGIGVLSVGNGAAGGDAFYFDFTSSGSINVSFDDITPDGNIYCYDNLRNRPSSLESGHSDPLQGYLFLQMTGKRSLKIEWVQQNGSCPADPNTLSFSGAAVVFER